MARNLGPLRLQTCCFRKLICDLETFPFESLALLPLKLRHELIKNLPAVDVCQLEQSSFVEGLDMEDVWATISEKCWLGKPPTQSKDIFFSEVCQVILTNNSDYDLKRFFSGLGDLALKRLFSFQQYLGVDDCSFPDSHRPEFQLPLRYKEYSDLSLSKPSKCIRVILEKTQYHPKHLLIDNAYKFYIRFISPKLTKRSRKIKRSRWLKGGKFHSLLVDYLSHVCHLTIKLKRLDLRYLCRADRYHRVTPFIMQVLSSKSQYQIKEVSIISEDVSFCFLHIAMIAVSRYLKESKGNQHNELESLSIKGDFAIEALQELAQIIESQTSLCKLELEIYRTRSFDSLVINLCIVPLCTALAGLFRQPQFREMKVHVLMPPSSFQQIMHSFITVPRREECRLHLGGVLTKEPSLDRGLSCLSPPQENIIQKSLLLKVDLPDMVLQWLHEHVVLRVKELHFSPQLLPILNHPRMEVESLYLSFGVDSHGFSQSFDQIPPQIFDQIPPQSFDQILPQSFDQILQNVHLKDLWIHIHGNAQVVITSLVHGLHQAQLGSLEMLKMRITFGDKPKAEIRQLFEAVVFLPRLEKFTLDFI